MLGLLLLVPLLLAAPSGRLAICDYIEEPSTLDPMREFSSKAHTILQQVYEPLARFDPAGKIEPALAKSWSRVDALTMEFKLREGVRFHNGEVMEAATVKRSIDRYLDPAAGFPGRGFIQTIKKTVVVDPRTVRVITHAPDGLLLNRLAAFVFILPATADIAEKPIGTGAFRYAGRELGKELRFEANPDYWDPALPRVRELVFKFIPQDMQIDALLNGEVDILTDIPGTATRRIAASGRAKVLKTPSFYTVGATFETKEGPLKDRRVRQALNYGVDRRDLMRYDQFGNAQAIASLAMPGASGFDPSLKPYPHDPARARKLLAEAGFADGLTLKAIVKRESKRTAQILSRQWEKIGVKLDVVWTDDYQAVDDMHRVKLDLGFGGCPDPMATSFSIASMFLYSRSPFSLTRSVELDGLIEKAASQLTEEALQQALVTLNRYVHEEAMSLFTYQRIVVAAVREGVEYRPYVTGLPYLFSARVPGAK